MQATQILLGRPWQFDRGTTHDGISNRYSFEFNGKKIVLNPLPPSEVAKDQACMAESIRKEKALEEALMKPKEVKKRKTKGESTKRPRTLKDKSEGEGSVLEDKEEKKETLLTCMEVKKSLLVEPQPMNSLLEKDVEKEVEEHRDVLTNLLPTTLFNLLQVPKDDLPKELPSLDVREHGEACESHAIVPYRPVTYDGYTESIALGQQVGEKCDTGWETKSFHLCAVSIVLDKEGIWHLCIGCPDNISVPTALTSLMCFVSHILRRLIDTFLTVCFNDILASCRSIEVHYKQDVFKPSGWVWTYVHKEKAVGQLQTGLMLQGHEPFHILPCLYSNAYALKLPDNFDTSFSYDDPYLLSFVGHSNLKNVVVTKVLVCGQPLVIHHTYVSEYAKAVAFDPKAWIGAHMCNAQFPGQRKLKDTLTGVEPFLASTCNPKHDFVIPLACSFSNSATVKIDNLPFVSAGLASVKYEPPDSRTNPFQEEEPDASMLEMAEELAEELSQGVGSRTKTRTRQLARRLDKQVKSAWARRRARRLEPLSERTLLCCSLEVELDLPP